MKVSLQSTTVPQQSDGYIILKYNSSLVTVYGWIIVLWILKINAKRKTTLQKQEHRVYSQKILTGMVVFDQNFHLGYRQRDMLKALKWSC